MYLQCSLTHSLYCHITFLTSLWWHSGYDHSASPLQTTVTHTVAQHNQMTLNHLTIHGMHNNSSTSKAFKILFPASSRHAHSKLCFKLALGTHITSHHDQMNRNHHLTPIRCKITPAFHKHSKLFFSVGVS